MTATEKKKFAARMLAARARKNKVPTMKNSKPTPKTKQPKRRKRPTTLKPSIKLTHRQITKRKKVRRLTNTTAQQPNPISTTVRPLW